MKPIVRLLVAYFAGTRLARGMTLAGLAMILLGSIGVLLLNTLRLSLGTQALLLVLPQFGVLTLFFGSALMPRVATTLAFGRLVHVLPYARVKLAASVLLTLLALTTLTGLIAMVFYLQLPTPLRLAFWRSASVAFMTYTLLYVIVWWIGRARTSMGVLGGAMLVIATLSLPMRAMADPSGSRLVPLLLTAFAWIAAIAALLSMPRLKIVLAAMRQRHAARRAPASDHSRYRRGREADLLVGVGRPWLLALGQVLPIVVATYFISEPRVWLFYFVLFSAISGAVTCLAAPRSRALWLRTWWDRAELFRRIEAAFWRHNGCALLVLLLLFPAIGLHERFPPSMLGFGLLLLVLGSLTSTYLGLMITRGIGMGEASLAIATMMLLMAAAIQAAAAAIDVPTVIALEISLAIVAFAFRHVAKQRWSGIDWMRCRAERAQGTRRTA